MIFLGLLHHIQRHVQFIFFADALANLSALRFGESVGHAAAENQVVDLAQQVFDDTNLGRHLRATHDSGEGAFDVVEHGINGLHFFLHEIAQHLVVGIEIIGDDCRRSMFAVSRTEGVHHVAIGIRSQFLREIFLARFHLLLRLVIFGRAFLNAHGLALFFGIETEVLQQQRFAGLQCSRFGFGMATIFGKFHLNAQCVRHIFHDLRERELSLHLTFGLAHVAHHDERATIGQHLLQRWQCTANARVVSHFSIFVQGDIEVHANDCLLTSKIKLFDSHFTVIFDVKNLSFYARQRYGFFVETGKPLPRFHCFFYAITVFWHIKLAIFQAHGAPSKRVAGEEFADKQTRGMIGGEVPADGQTHGMIAGRGV